MTDTMAAPKVVQRNIVVTTTDAWFDEVRDYIELLRRPDADQALFSKLNSRAGRPHDHNDASVDNYLVNAFVAALRYADAIAKSAYGSDVIPSARNPKPAREEPRKIRREIERDADGRVLAVVEIR